MCRFGILLGNFKFRKQWKIQQYSFHGNRCVDESYLIGTGRKYPVGRAFNQHKIKINFIKALFKTKFLCYNKDV